jgi:cell wall-associated NlpC family hydrolase
MKQLLAALGTALALSLTLFAAVSVSHPEAASAASSTPKRVTAFNFAKSQAGKPYCYGGEGSAHHSASCYDCSGLVYTAYLHAGIRLPRTADAQRSSSKTYRISKSHAKDGDLIFWGYGHVELVDRVGSTVYRYGAHHSRTRLSRERLYGSPVFYHVKTAG